MFVGLCVVVRVRGVSGCLIVYCCEGEGEGVLMGVCCCEG